MCTSTNGRRAGSATDTALCDTRIDRPFLPNRRSTAQTINVPFGLNRVRLCWSGSGRNASVFGPDAKNPYSRPCTHVAGIRSAGLSRLLIDGRQVAEAWESWSPGTAFFEEGSPEMTGEVVLEAWQTCPVVIEFAAKAAKWLAFSALGAGIIRPLGAQGIADAVAAAKVADVSVVCVGRTADWDGEGQDLPHITLPGEQNALIAAVAAANPRTVVALQTGGPVEMPWAGDVAAILQAWYPGQEVGNPVANLERLRSSQGR